MKSNRLIGPVIVTLLAVGAPLILWLVDMSLRSRQPEFVPLHWNFSGEVDRTTTPGAMASLTLILAAVFAVVAVVGAWLSLRHFAGRFAAAMLVFGAYTAAGTTIATFSASKDVADPLTVAAPLGSIFGIIGIAAVVALAVWILLPQPRGMSTDTLEPLETPLTIDENETVWWADTVFSRPLRLSAVALAVVAVAALLWAPAEVAVMVCLISLSGAVIMVLFSEAAIIIDSSGLQVRFGPLGWPRSHVPLADMMRAASGNITPGQWGGWGYRVSPRGTAVVLRKGPGIFIARRDKSLFAVSTDQADAGVEVINALLNRRGGKKKGRKKG